MIGYGRDGRLSPRAPDDDKGGVGGSAAPSAAAGTRLIGVSASRAALMGQDRPLRRKIIGGGSRRRRHQDCVGRSIPPWFALVDQDPQARRLNGSGENSATSLMA